MFKNGFIFGIILIGILFSCENENVVKSENTMFDLVKNESPVLKGYEIDKERALDQQKRKRVNYHVLYIGELSDTIVFWNVKNNLRLPPPVLDENGIPIESIKEKKYRLYRDSLETINNYVKRGLYFKRNHYYLEIGDSLLNIIIDTTEVIIKEDFNTTNDSSFLFKAFPVYITNNSKDSIVVGFNNKLSIILEAQNENIIPN